MTRETAHSEKLREAATFPGPLLHDYHRSVLLTQILANTGPLPHGRCCRRRGPNSFMIWWTTKKQPVASGSVDPPALDADPVIDPNEVAAQRRALEHDLVAACRRYEPARCILDLPGRIAFGDFEDERRTVDLTG